MAKGALKSRDHPVELLAGEKKVVALASGSAGKPAPTRGRKGQVPMKRLCIYMPVTVYEELEEFSAERGETLTSTMRWALSTAKAVWDVIKGGHKIEVADRDNERRGALIFTR